MTEDYRRIKDFPNYIIYKDGRVQNNKTKYFLKFKINKGKIRRKKTRFGYYSVNLYNCETKKLKTFYIHRLLGEYFIPNPENKPTIDHINENSLDNRLENLRWATYEEQLMNRCSIRSHNKLQERYINIRNRKKKNSKGEEYIYSNYRFRYRNFSKVFSKLEDAINFRDNYLDNL